MATFGKKILAAFVEVNDDSKQQAIPESRTPSTAGLNAPAKDDEKFIQYFNKLFAEANLPGPDYFEFVKMTEAMSSISDMHTRYVAAYAGLQVQGLDKNKLLSSAAEYLRVLDNDEKHFLETIESAQKERVVGKRQQVEDTQARLKALQNEMEQLQQALKTLEDDARESERKLNESTVGYKSASKNMRARIEQDINNIKQFIN